MQEGGRYSAVTPRLLVLLKKFKQFLKAENQRFPLIYRKLQQAQYHKLQWSTYRWGLAQQTEKVGRGLQKLMHVKYVCLDASMLALLSCAYYDSDVSMAVDFHTRLNL